MSYIEKEFTVTIPVKRGRTSFAQDILKCVSEYRNSVYIEKNGRTVSANSLIGIVSLGLENGDNIKVSCMGNDEFSTKLFLEKLGFLFVNK